MTFDDPAADDLNRLFHDPALFESRAAWRRAGFTVAERSSPGKIMVASHADVPGRLFKKYASTVGDDDQRRNYERRVEGADQLRAFTERHQLSRIAIPRKWIVPLPRRFGRRARILVVERLDLCAESELHAAYRAIDPRTLADLCMVVAQFRGLDSIVKNMPVLADGRIGFVDTEHWDRRTSKAPLHQVVDLLTRDRRRLARTIFERVRDGRSIDVERLVSAAGAGARA